MHAQGRPGLQILGQAEETINVPIALPLTEWMQIARFAAQDGRSVVEYVRAMVHTFAVSEDPGERRIRIKKPSLGRSRPTMIGLLIC